MKTIDLGSFTQTHGKPVKLGFPSLRLPRQLIRMAWSAALLTAVVTLAAYALSRGESAIVGAMLLTTGFLILAVAVDRPDAKSFIQAALLGVLVMMAALLGRFVASEFHLMGAALASLAAALPWSWNDGSP